MVFSSPIFLFFFLPAVLFLYLVAGKKLRNTLLLFASLFFYAWGEGAYVIFLLLSILMNYVFGIGITRSTQMASTSGDKKKKVWLTIAVSVNLLMLGVFKYAAFFVENINIALGWFGDVALHVPDIRLPIGISFFTFQALSYVVDVYRKKVGVQKNILDLGLYISLFPQLIAGPIVRYSDVQSQIKNRKVSLALFTSGISRFITGLAKKVIVANTLAQVADNIFALPVDQIGISAAWLAVVCYTFQIYFDFSGYSDMAIGLGRMFGFRFLENFNYPYISQSIKEFWRRWHISLSTWFRDYLYFPLGGNRKGKYRTYLNLMIVFLLTGFWHGASWNFMFWGAYYGFFLILERIGFDRILKRMYRPFRHMYALLVVVVGWVFFRVESMHDAFAYLATMFGFSGVDRVVDTAGAYLNTKVLFVLVFAAVLSLPVIPVFREWYTKLTLRHSAVARATIVGDIVYVMVLLGLFALSVLLVASDTYNPFIYFRF